MITVTNIDELKPDSRSTDGLYLLCDHVEKWIGVWGLTIEDGKFRAESLQSVFDQLYNRIGIEGPITVTNLQFDPRSKIYTVTRT